MSRPRSRHYRCRCFNQFKIRNESKLRKILCSENSLLWRSSFVQYSLMHFDQINRFEMNCIFKNLLRIDHFVRRWFQSSQDYMPIEYFWMNFLGLDLSGTILQQLKSNHRHLVLTCFRLNDLFDWSWNQLWNQYLPWKYKSCNLEIFQGSKFSFLTFDPYFAE